MGGTDSGLGFGLSFGLQDNFSAGAATIQNSFNSLRDGANRVANQVEDAMGKIYQGFGQVAAGVALFMPLKAAIDAFAEMDSLERGMTAIMKSSKAAKEEMLKLREVAKLPGLGVKEAIEGSINLQASGMSADLARRALMGFGAALATVGRGKAYLSGVNLALSQIMSKGKVSAQEINQLSERVPQMRKLMQAAFGTSDTEKMGKMGISAEKFILGIVNQLEKLEKPVGGIGNAFENLSDSLYLLLVAIGKPLAPFVESLANSVAELAVSVEKFVATEFGATVVKIAAAFLTLVGSTLILRGITSSFKGFIKLIDGFGVPLTNLFRVFGGTFKGINMLIQGNTEGAMKLLSRFNKAFLAFVTNPAFIAFAVIAIAAYGAYQAYQTFTNFLEGKSGKLTGFMGIVQKIGGVLHGIGEILGSVTDEGWLMSEGLYNALQKIGVLDTVLAIGTWIVRIRAMFQGFGQAISESFAIVGKMFSKVKASLFKMLGPELTASITRLTSNLSIFKTIGYVIGWVFKVAIVIIGSLIAAIVVLGGFIVKIGAMIIHAASWVVSGVMSMVGAIVDFVMSIPNMLGTLFSWLGDLAKSAFNIGVNFVNSLWDGIKSIWSKFSDWITEKWNGITGFMGFAPVGNNQSTNTSPSQGQTTEGANWLHNLTDQRIQSSAVPFIAAQYSQPAQGATTSTTSEILKSIQLDVHLDSQKISQSVSNNFSLDDARNGY